MDTTFTPVRRVFFCLRGLRSLQHTTNVTSCTLVHSGSKFAKYPSAEHSVCFHMYALKANKKQRNRVDKFWENLLLYLSAKQPAMKRLNTLIGMADWPENEWPQEDKELYTLGQVRNTTTFFQTFGIHIEEQTVEPHLCKFVQTPAMMQAFMPALRQNGMGLDYDKIDYEYVHNYLDKS